jgi:hypothetical protein
MRRLSSLRLEELIHEALQESRAQQKRFQQQFPEAPAAETLGYPHPHTRVDLLAGKALVSTEKAKRSLIDRLKRFQYPYPQGNKARKTFYRHLKDNGLFDVLLSLPLIFEVQGEWFSRRYYDRERKSFERRQSHHGYPLAFHEEMMYELAEHLDSISEVPRRYRVPKSWFATYRKVIQQQLLREASICHPELLRDFTHAADIRPRQRKGEREANLFGAIERAFAERGVVNHKLAQQLTALICSPPDCIRTHKLDPSPETIRRNR